jgi:hypothetical protein
MFFFDRNRCQNLRGFENFQESMRNCRFFQVSGEKLFYYNFPVSNIKIKLTALSNRKLARNSFLRLQTKADIQYLLKKKYTLAFPNLPM